MVLAVELTFPKLVESFAIDALCGGGPCLKPAQTNLDATGIAKAVVFLFQTLEGLIDFLNQFSFSITRA